MQEFLRDHQWRHPQVRDQLQRRVRRLAGLPDDGLGNVGLVDETSAVKSGTKTPGVQRQYLGCVGKIDNGVVTVHLGVCKGRYKTLIDALFLPEDWAKDRDRCADVLVIWLGTSPPGREVLPVHAPADAKLRTLVRVAFRRWNVEHGFRVGKSELGFTHYEGRNYTGPMRRQTLCLRMPTFVAGRTERLRGEKSGGDDGAGVQRVEPAEPGVAGEAAGDHSPSAQAGCHRLPPAAESGRTRVPSGPPQEKAS